MWQTANATAAIFVKRCSTACLLYTSNWFAVFGVVLGAVVANLVPWGIASINGMIVAAVCYLVGSKAKK